MKDPKFKQWLNNVAKIRNWDVNNMFLDNTYNYEHFYNAQPKEALKMLNKNADAHFSDIAKTAFHPTFSNLSDYSGKVSRYNQNGIIGGTWSAAPNLGRNASRYTLSDSQMKHGWDVLRTINYLIDAEQKGAELRMPDGSYPIIDGDIFGGVLPQIDVVGANRRILPETIDNTRVVINPSKSKKPNKVKNKLNKPTKQTKRTNDYTDQLFVIDTKDRKDGFNTQLIRPTNLLIKYY